MTSKVSVVIPVYNQAHFLSDAVHSVAAQDASPVEIIVVNDGSPDTPLLESVLQQCAAAIIYVKQDNRGVSAARNAGLARATGEFIHFLDADDRLLPHAVRTGLDDFAAHPDSAFVWGFRRVIDRDGNVVDTEAGDLGRPDHYAELLQTNIVGPPVAVMFRREPLLDVGGFAVLPQLSEDYDLYLRLAARHAFHCHRTIVADYRRHNSNLSADHAAMLIGVLHALKRQRAGTRHHPELRRALRRGYADAYWRYDWGPRLAELRHDARARRWRKSGAAAFRLFLRYPARLSAQVLATCRRRFTGIW